MRIVVGLDLAVINRRAILSTVGCCCCCCCDDLSSLLVELDMVEVVVVVVFVVVVGTFVVLLAVISAWLWWPHQATLVSLWQSLAGPEQLEPCPNGSGLRTSQNRNQSRKSIGT